MTAQLVSVDCCAILQLVERLAEDCKAEKLFSAPFKKHQTQPSFLHHLQLSLTAKEHKFGLRKFTATPMTLTTVG